MDIYKTRECNKECSRQNLHDQTLVNACREMEKGLVDADLGSGLYKKRIGTANQGKSGGYRLMVAAKTGDRYFFLHLFPKNAKGNISSRERKALRLLAKQFLEMNGKDIQSLLKDGSLIRVGETNE